MDNPKISIPIETHSSKFPSKNTLIIPQKSPSCGFKNFNVWGTTTDDNLRIEVKCMRYGKTAHSLKHNLTS